MRSVVEAADEDVTLLLSTHLVDELESVVDVAIFLKQSNLIEVRDTEELRISEGKSIVDRYREIYGNGGEVLC